MMIAIVSEFIYNRFSKRPLRVFEDGRKYKRKNDRIINYQLILNIRLGKK